MRKIFVVILAVYAALMSTFNFYKMYTFQEGFWPWYAQTVEVINNILKYLELAGGAI